MRCWHHYPRAGLPLRKRSGGGGKLALTYAVALSGETYEAPVQLHTGPSAAADEPPRAASSPPTSLTHASASAPLSALQVPSLGPRKLHANKKSPKLGRTNPHPLHAHGTAAPPIPGHGRPRPQHGKLPLSPLLPNGTATAKASPHSTTGGTYIPPEQLDAMSETVAGCADLWFQLDLDRKRAQLLLAAEPVGAFVVRQSSTQGAMVFTMKGPAKFANILVAHTLQGYKFTKLRWFETSLARLIAHIVLDEAKRAVLGLSVQPKIPLEPGKMSNLDPSRREEGRTEGGAGGDATLAGFAGAAAGTGDEFGFGLDENAVYLSTLTSLDNDDGVGGSASNSPSRHGSLRARRMSTVSFAGVSGLQSCRDVTNSLLGWCAWPRFLASARASLPQAPVSVPACACLTLSFQSACLLVYLNASLLSSLRNRTIARSHHTTYG